MTIPPFKLTHVAATKGSDLLRPCGLYYHCEFFWKWIEDFLFSDLLITAHDQSLVAANHIEQNAPLAAPLLACNIHQVFIL